MGTKRVEGKQKKKSIKAKVTSKFASKRKLSRMGKKIKKGMMGPSTDFITRSAVLKKLQITLKDFRRLCILKGIYPRVPVKAPKGSDKVYYDIKDISYLSHEPLLAKFREFKSFMKKIRKAAGRRQFDEAKRKDRMKPVLNMDHLVRERYPRFIDALRDLDDALCMIHLFATLPSIGRITAERTNKCNELTQHWQYIIMKSKALRKTFVSVKGIYFQAEFMGELITWIVPHSFTQTVPKEVDLRVMMTFLEFYEVFLKFVLFKLYNMEGLNYPPTIDKNLYDNGCCLLSIKTSSLNSSNSSSSSSSSLKNLIDNTTNATDNSDHNNNSSSLMNIDNDDDSNNNMNKANKNKKSATPSSKTAFSPDVLQSLNHKIQTIATVTANEDSDDDDNDDDEETGKLAGPLAEVFANLHGTSSSSSITTNGTNNSITNHHNNNNKTADETDEDKKVFHLAHNDKNRTDLFSKFKFFINREVPLNWMQFCILSFGGHLGWEDKNTQLSPFTADDTSITHHIIDRPLIQGSVNGSVPTNGNSSLESILLLSREYIQPQWIFDCINMKMILPVQHYKPGNKLPPHLSPFVDDEKEGYVPKYRQEIQKLQIQLNGQNDSSSSSSSSSSGSSNAMMIDSSANNDDDDDEDDNDNDNEENDDDDDDEEEEKVEEVKSSSSSSSHVVKGPKAIVYQPKLIAATEDEEANELSKVMMSKKTKRLYGRMQHGINKKKDIVNVLQEKRDKHEQISTTTTTTVAAITTATTVTGNAKTTKKIANQKADTTITSTPKSNKKMKSN